MYHTIGFRSPTLRSSVCCWKGARHLANGYPYRARLEPEKQYTPSPEEQKWFDAYDYRCRVNPSANVSRMNQRWIELARHVGPIETRSKIERQIEYFTIPICLTAGFGMTTLMGLELEGLGHATKLVHERELMRSACGVLLGLSTVTGLTSLLCSTLYYSRFQHVPGNNAVLQLDYIKDNSSTLDSGALLTPPLYMYTTCTPHVRNCLVCPR
jgi:hypothetical protein